VRRGEGVDPDRRMHAPRRPARRTAPLDPPRRVGPGEGERDPPGDRPSGRRGRDLPAPGPRDRPERAVRVYGHERGGDPGGLSAAWRSFMTPRHVPLALLGALLATEGRAQEVLCAWPGSAQ